MSRKQTTWTLSLAAVILLGAALWQAIQHWEWLEARHLAGIATLDLIALGVLAFAIPLHLNSLPETMSPGQMAWDVLWRSTLAMLAFTALGGLFALIGWLLTLPARMGRPYLLLPALLILTPIGAAVADILRGPMQRTPGNLLWRWLHHNFELYYLLLIQLGTLPIAFLLFPAGFFIQLLTLVEEGIRLFGQGPFDTLPLLCEWANVSPTACTPLLATFHVGHLVLALLAAKFGSSLLDKAADGYAAGQAWLAERIVY